MIIMCLFTVQDHKIFNFTSFAWHIFLLDTGYPVRAISNFLKNFWKILNQGCGSVSTLKWQAGSRSALKWFRSATQDALPLLLKPAARYHWRHWHRHHWHWYQVCHWCLRNECMSYKLKWTVSSSFSSHIFSSLQHLSFIQYRPA